MRQPVNAAILSTESAHGCWQQTLGSVLENTFPDHTAMYLLPGPVKTDCMEVQKARFGKRPLGLVS